MRISERQLSRAFEEAVSRPHGAMVGDVPEPVGNQEDIALKGFLPLLPPKEGG